jgi:phosphate-selective porin
MTAGTGGDELTRMVPEKVAMPTASTARPRRIWRDTLTSLMTGTLLLSTVIPASAQEPAPDAGKLTVAPTGYIQFDWHAFPGWDATPGTGRLNRATAEIRRASVGLEASWRRVSFEVSVDPRDDDGIFVKDAYAQLRVNRRWRIRVGQFKIPGTREYDGSARRLDFLERTALTESLAVRRDIGARADGSRGPIGYEFGLFAGDGVGRDERAGLTVAGRVTWQVNRDLQVGGSVSDGKTKAVESDDPNGLQGRSSSGYRFLESVYVQGQRVRVGGDVEWSPGPWRFVAEALQVRDDRLEQGLDYEDLPSVVGTGASLSGRRRLTSRLEGALRYDYLGFDDTGDGSTADSVRPRATNLRARAHHALTLGSTWEVNRWTRILGHVGLERYSEQRSAPEAGKSGAYPTLGLRLQLEWP